MYGFFDVVNLLSSSPGTCDAKHLGPKSHETQATTLAAGIIVEAM